MYKISNVGTVGGQEAGSLQRLLWCGFCRAHDRTEMAKFHLSRRDCFSFVSFHSVFSPEHSHYDPGKTFALHVARILISLLRW